MQSSTNSPEARRDSPGAGPRLPRLVALTLLFVTVSLWAAYALSLQTGPMAPQSRANINAAGSASLIGAVTKYPKVWPPAYPAPLVFLQLLIRAPGVLSARRRCLHLISYVVPSLIITLPWLLHLRRLTGSLSGGDRTIPRSVGPAIEVCTGCSDFELHVFFTLKTLAIDLLSPSRTARHRVVNQSELSAVEIALCVTVALLVVWALVSRFRCITTKPTVAAATDWIRTSATSLPLQFLIGHIVMTILIWTYANNDPIYTRFMFPSYPFVVLSMLSLYSEVRARKSSSWSLAPFYLMTAIFLTANLVKWL
jgi:hypothetical protein